MDKHELSEMANRYTNLDLGLFIHMHMKKAETTSDEQIRVRELESAKVYHEVLGHKIAVLEDV